jgi:hypothetical protein
MKPKGTKTNPVMCAAEMIGTISCWCVMFVSMPAATSTVIDDSTADFQQATGTATVVLLV